MPGTALLRAGKGLRDIKIQLRNRRRNRKDFTFGIRRRSQVENTNKNTVSHITITHTTLHRNWNRDQRIPVYCSSRHIHLFPQPLVARSSPLTLGVRKLSGNCRFAEPSSSSRKLIGQFDQRSRVGRGQVFAGFSNSTFVVFPVNLSTGLHLKFWERQCHGRSHHDFTANCFSHVDDAPLCLCFFDDLKCCRHNVISTLSSECQGDVKFKQARTNDRRNHDPL